MHIVHLAAGAGGMYCGSCLHGNTLAAALRQAGQQVTLVPLYTPLRTDEPAESGDDLFFGGINVYLQQHSALFRHTPHWIDRLWDHPVLRGRLARAGSTRPGKLGPLCVSMLRGEEGRQRKELEKLLAWLAGQPRPDVVHLSSVLLAGLARPIRQRLGVPVVCTLSGEDFFLDQLPAPYDLQARVALAMGCRDLAALVAMNNSYAELMTDYLPVPRERIWVIPPGLNLADHAAPLADAQTPARRGTGPYTIGYLSRISPEKGLDHLAQAALLLAQQADLPAFRLQAAGYLSPADRPYLAEIEKHLARGGLADRFQYLGELDRAAKIAFLQSLDLLSVPTLYPESKGLAILEAWANGVPVVLPNQGAFAELVADTGGGLLYEPGNPAALAEALGRMIRDPALASTCGRRAQQAVHQRYHATQMAQRTIAMYKAVVGG